jgi:Protein of unknown function (DUF3604)
MVSHFDPPREAGFYHAPEGLYARNKKRPFLGTLSCDRSRLVAGEWTELKLVYEVGAAGLADGGWLKLAFKFYSDWALFQTSDPHEANFVSAEYHAGDLVSGQSPATVRSLAVRFDQKGHERPFQKAIMIDVVDGYLNPGDRIVVRIGDRRQGGAGTRVQTFVESGFRFRMFIDPLGSSKFAEVPGDCLIDIVPGPPASLQLIAPRLHAPGNPLACIIRADDVWGNTCWDLPADGVLRITSPSGQTQEKPVTLNDTGWAICRLADIPLDECGEWALSAALSMSPGVEPIARYITVEDGPAPLYADLHVHSDDTVGTNDTSYNLSYGRDVAGLDVLGYTANDFNITQERWNRAVELIHSLNEDGRFVCFPGTEWCGNSSAGGDRNVVFLHGRAPEFPFDDQGRMVRSVDWNEATDRTMRPGTWPVDELYAAYAKDPEGHLLMPHVGGRRCILDWHHPELERLIEIGSAWGQFPWVYADALSRGYRLGAAANSDEHQGRCGGGVPGTAVFGSRGGLTGVFAERFDRASVARALRARRTFATTGERTVVTLKHGSTFMGSEGTLDPGGTLDLRLLGDAGWEEIAIYDADRLVWRRDEHRRLGISRRRLRIRMGGARIKDRYRGAWWSGTLRVRGTPILDVASFGFDHPEQSFWRESADTVAFHTVTNGDSDSIELTLEDIGDAVFEFEATIHGYVKVGDPLRPPVHADLPVIRLKAQGSELLAGEAVRHDGGGAELLAAIEPVTERPLPRDLALTVPIGELDLTPQPEHRLFVTARQRDQSRVWTSALFLTSG